MTNGDLVRAIGHVLDTDDPRALARLEAELRDAHPGDREADVVARQAALKRRRLSQAN